MAKATANKTPTRPKAAVAQKPAAKKAPSGHTDRGEALRKAAVKTATGATAVKKAPKEGTALKATKKAPKAAAVAAKPVAEKAHDFVVGHKIKHQTFGVGTVREVKGDILGIEFKNGELKFIREDFVARA